MLPFADLNRGLDAAGLSGPAFAHLRAFGVTTIADFIELDETRLQAWRVCRPMRMEIATRQRAVMAGELIRRGAFAVTLNSLLRCPAALAQTAFYFFLTLAPLAIAIAVAGRVLRAVF